MRSWGPRLRARVRAHWIVYTVISVIVLIIVSGLVYSFLFGPAQSDIAALEEYVVIPGSTIEFLAEDLEEKGFAKNSWALKTALSGRADDDGVRAGAYSISKSMDAWALSKALTGLPYMVFVTFPPSIRKEQMGERLAEALGWSGEELVEWNTIATEPDPAFIEGVYYPDTYLIPTDQSPSQVAARMRGRFTDMFEPYAQAAQEQNIPWTDVLTLASIVDREASKVDRELVAAILWNRLDIGMKLQADATLQYIKGTSRNWWPVPTSADKYLESAFNTYQHAGLPPHPINNPSLESIAAVLSPEPTNCLFYIHDYDHVIHCSITYAGHQSNIDTYLR